MSEPEKNEDRGPIHKPGTIEWAMGILHMLRKGLKSREIEEKTKKSPEELKQAIDEAAENLLSGKQKPKKKKNKGD